MSLRTLCSASVLFAVACMPAWPEGDTSGGGDDGGVPIGDVHVGYVYIGPVGDHGWTKSHDDGRLEMEEALGVTTSYVPSVIPADAISTMDTMMADGANILFTTSFDFVSQTQQAASSNPDASFLSCSGGVYGENLSSYMGRMYQAMYLAGMVAGRMTATNRVGMLLSVPIPEIVRHANAFALGAREVNPNVVVEVAWVNNWFDPELEPALTNQLIANGADIITNQTDTTIPLETAAGQSVTYVDGSGATQSQPVYSIGYDNPDSCSHAPDSCLTSAYWNWGPMYTAIVQSIAEGSWDPSNIIWEQMKATPSESSMALADFNGQLVPGEVRLEVEGKIPSLVAEEGRQLPFVGPITDSTGDLRLEDGEELTDDQLNRLCWFVDGIVSNNGSGDVPAEVPSGCGGDT